MTTTPRQRLLILFAVVFLFALLYPFSRYIARERPPCHEVVMKCREMGRYDARAQKRRGLYRECIMGALRTGSVGDFRFSAGALEPCREKFTPLLGE